jgi:hypothetical protein
VRLRALALAALALALPGSATAAVRSELDRPSGLRVTLDGRTLTAEIAHTPRFTRSPTTEGRTVGRKPIDLFGRR